MGRCSSLSTVRPTPTARAARGRLARTGLLHAARLARLQTRPPLEALEPSVLLAQLGHGLLQPRNLVQKIQNKILEFSVLQVINSVGQGVRHDPIESENHQLEKIISTD